MASESLKRSEFKLLNLKNSFLLSNLLLLLYNKRRQKGKNKKYQKCSQKNNRNKKR